MMRFHLPRVKRYSHFPKVANAGKCDQKPLFCLFTHDFSLPCPRCRQRAVPLRKSHFLRTNTHISHTVFSSLCRPLRLIRTDEPDPLKTGFSSLISPGSRRFQPRRRVNCLQCPHLFAGPEP